MFVQPSLSDSEDLEEMERLRKEHIEALREIKRLQVDSRLSHFVEFNHIQRKVGFSKYSSVGSDLQEQLVESQRVHHQMEEELSKVKQVSHACCTHPTCARV